MKKLILFFVVMAMASTAFAKDGGSFLTDRIGDIVLHTYQSNDPLGDASFIVESENTLVIIDPIAFKSAATEFTTYIDKLHKPVSKVIVTFHPGGLSSYPYGPKFIVKSLDAFTKSDAGKGMLEHFGQVFQGDMDVNIGPYDAVIEPDQKIVVDGVTYQFTPTKVPGMPGCNLTINDEIFYGHFTPAANMHPSPFYITDQATLAAALAENKNTQEQGYKLFIGAHLPGRAEAADLKFQIRYLEALQTGVESSDSPETLASAMKQQFPGCKGESNLDEIAKKLF